jgi:hypothetical protein
MGDRKDEASGDAEARFGKKPEPAKGADAEQQQTGKPEQCRQGDAMEAVTAPHRDRAGRYSQPEGGRVKS